MNKKAMRKDFYMEIRTSLGRFLSIFFIVALGVAFFSGIRAAQPDMLVTGDNYFDAEQLMDIRAISTLGITKEDVTAISEVDGVERVIGGYSLDVLSKEADNQEVLHIMSILPTMNAVTVTEGRLPEAEDECLVDDETEYKVGDIIQVESGNSTPVTDSLTSDRLVVVGTGSSPCYISFGRGSTNIGTGSISGFVMVPEDAFHMDVYTEAYVKVEGAQKLEAYSDAYEDKVETVLENIEDIADARCDIRKQDLTDEANEELDKARQELEDGKKKAQEELADAQKQITDGETQLNDAKAQIASGESAIAEAKATLTEKQQELNDAIDEYNAGRQQLEDGWAQYTDGYNEYQAQLNTYNQGLEQYNQGMAGVDAIQAQIDQINAGLNSQRQALDAQWAQYNEMAASDDPATQAAAAELKAQLDQAENEYATGKATADATISGLQGKQEEIKTQLEPVKQGLDAGAAGLNEGKATLDASKATLDASQAQLDSALSQINDGQAQIDDGWNQISEQEATLAAAKSEVAAKEPELADAKAKYEDGKKEADQEIADGEQKLKDAEKEVAKIEHPTWYVNDRTTLPEYSGYGENAERMKAIGQVFPVLFFLVAALISLTSMTRMVEEQRLQIGTLKALGYGKLAIASKYLGYAFVATLGGSIFGVLIGEKVLPYIIIYAYGIMYHHITDILVPYNMYYAVMATAAALVSTMLATTLACYKELAAQPAALMRPPAPKKGKRVFLERITIIWKHLSFIWKSTIRNLFRYKKRFFMTVFGIGGCMALMLVGFGLRDSIFEIAQIQYKDIELYDATAFMQDDASEEDKEELDTYLEQDENVKNYLNVLIQNVTLVHGSEEWDAYETVPEDAKKMSQFVNFHDRITKKEYTLNDDGIIINEKTAKMLDAKVGDTIEIKDTDMGNKPVKIAAINENYMGHYFFMSKNLYEEVYDETLETNTVYIETVSDSRAKLEATGEEILNKDAVLNISYLHDIERQLDDMLKSLNLVIVVLIVSAGMLAFVVLYNLNNINITERRRELATLKVLGFYDNEVSAYVYRENIVLTFVGAAAGVIMGIFLHRFTIQTVEVDSVMFGRIINFPSYIYSILFTLAFSLFVNWVMYFKLKKIDMVESLKSVE